MEERSFVVPVKSRAGIIYCLFLEDRKLYFRTNADAIYADFLYSNWLEKNKEKKSDNEIVNFLLSKNYNKV